MLSRLLPCYNPLRSLHDAAREGRSVTHRGERMRPLRLSCSSPVAPPLTQALLSRHPVSRSPAVRTGCYLVCQHCTWPRSARTGPRFAPPPVGPSCYPSSRARAPPRRPPAGAQPLRPVPAGAIFRLPSLSPLNARVLPAVRHVLRDVAVATIRVDWQVDTGTHATGHPTRPARLGPRRAQQHPRAAEAGARGKRGGDRSAGSGPPRRRAGGPGEILAPPNRSTGELSTLPLGPQHTSLDPTRT